jgi:hypothetical protein
MQITLSRLPAFTLIQYIYTNIKQLFAIVKIALINYCITTRRLNYLDTSISSTQGIPQYFSNQKILNSAYLLHIFVFV